MPSCFRLLEMRHLWLVGIAACSFRQGGAPGDGSATLDAGGWAHSRVLTLDNGGLDALSNFPLLVILEPSRIDYASTSPTGADLRFVDTANTQLAYEIEAWNPGASSYVWVGVPAIAAGAMTQITMLYGNPNAVDAQDPHAVWDAGYVGVWHLADAHDSTGKQTSMNNGAVPTDGVVGQAQMFDGAADIDTGTADLLTTFTIECWMSPGSAAMMVGGTNGSGPLSRGYNYQLEWNCGNPGFCQTANFRSSANGMGPVVPFGNPPVTQWSHVVAIYDGTNLATYLNSIPQMSMPAAQPIADPSTAKLGARSDAQTGDFFQGSVDEARISSIARSESYIVASYRAVNDAYVAFGPEQ